ncbi:MAG: hypothetical protein KIT69_08805 [Propionibacteriaceae bacterium]|nr:hypothetical protein [Propionibacteriaceae bacterium]
MTEPRFVDDNFPPVLNVPNGGLWELYRDEDCVEPDPLNLTALDECSGVRPVNVQTSRDPTDCIYIYTLTYTYSTEDECGNADSKDQVYNVVPANSPYFETLPGSFSAPCDDVPAQVDIKAFGPCGEELVVNKSEDVIPGDCPNEYTIVRVWKAVDACGTEIEHEQLVTVFDSEYPVLSPLPPHESVQCGFLPPVPRVYATDNCPGVNLTLTQEYFNNTEGHCCDFELHRTWTATDACNKTTTYTQIITVTDTIPPVLNIPGDESFECVPPADYKTVYEAYHPPLAVASCVAGSTNTAPGCTSVSSISRGADEFNFVAGESYWTLTLMMVPCWLPM